jgi:hypothetical protein
MAFVMFDPDRMATQAASTGHQNDRGVAGREVLRMLHAKESDMHIHSA